MPSSNTIDLGGVAPICTRITEELVKKVTGEYDLEVIQWVELPNMGIRRIENLNACTSIRTLNLCGNQIREIRGLEGLVSLERLDLSSNCIKRIVNLGHLTSLQCLDIKGNQISCVDDVATLKSLPSLRRFSLQEYQGDKVNPACHHPSYHTIVTRLLPRLEMLDGESLNLRKCVVDVVLENTKAGGEALRSPERRRWCQGFDWTLESMTTELDETMRAETEKLCDLLHDCARLNRQATGALRDIQG